MMRRFKALGLALVAVLSVSAIAASAAWAVANPRFKTSETTAILHAFQLADEGAGKINALTLDGWNITCGGGTLDGATLSPEAFSVELTPSYTGCKATFSGGTHFVTTTHNGCKYKFHTLATAGAHYSAKVDLVCPPGKKFEVHMYFFSDHTFQTCTYDVAPQSPLGSVTLTNENSGATGAIVAEGAFGNFTYTRTAGACGEEMQFNNGVRHIHWTVTGKNAMNLHRNVSVG